MKLLLLILLNLIFATSSYASTARFSWAPNTESDLAGYMLHFGAQPGVYTEHRDCGMGEQTEGRVFCTINDVPDGLTYFTVTAHDDAGNASEYADEISNNPSPSKPAEFMAIEVNVNVSVQ